MATRDIIQRYFDALRRKQAWQSFLADDMTFASHVTPVKQIAGKGAYLQSTSRFFSMITSVEVKDLIVDGEKACVLSSYALNTPGGAFRSDVAEVFTVRDGKIDSLAIYFDPTPFPK